MTIDNDEVTTRRDDAVSPRLLKTSDEKVSDVKDVSKSVAQLEPLGSPLAPSDVYASERGPRTSKNNVHVIFFAPSRLRLRCVVSAAVIRNVLNQVVDMFRTLATDSFMALVCELVGYDSARNSIVTSRVEVSTVVGD